MRADLASESSRLRMRLGFREAQWTKAAVGYLILIGVFGVFLPWLKGRDFLDSVILGAYSLLGVVFAAPAAAAKFEATPTRSEVLARVAVSVAYGELLAGSLVLLGLSTVYLSRWGRIVVGPDLRSLAECALLGVSLSLAICAAGAWVSVRFSPPAARTCVRMVFVGLLVSFYLRSGWLPAVALRAAGISMLISLVFLMALGVRTVATGRSEKP